jgi:hypothetical protein
MNTFTFQKQTTTQHHYIRYVEICWRGVFLIWYNFVDSLHVLTEEQEPRTHMYNLLQN